VPSKSFTHKQGQYLAFIYHYSKVNGQPPAEADMQRYFRVSPPSVHQMVVTLEANGFIERISGKGRSIRLLLARKDLPDLE
jgi:Mn-dependent DtxR family transcriptional regulator